MKTIYTLGYTGLTMEAIQKKVEELDAYLVDIRYMAGSRVPMWRGANFAKVFRDRYIHLNFLGNENYKGGELKIHNLPEGIRFIRNILPHNNVILMCACADIVTCHRRSVANRLHDALEVDIVHLAKEEIRPETKKKKESIQPLKLF